VSELDDLSTLVKAYLQAGLGLRYCVAIGLNLADPFKISIPRKLALAAHGDLIPLPNNVIEAETRRNIFWIGTLILLLFGLELQLMICQRMLLSVNRLQGIASLWH
jgi:hypothetical protein